MAIVFIHYHLSAGGVTRVIEETSRCLTRGGIGHVILTGSAPSSGGLPFHVIEGLAYRREIEGPTARELVGEMRAAVEKTLGPGPHVWHFHNHSLGVNVRMVEIVTILANEGERLVLQLHDLAEDGRPGNYRLLADGAAPCTTSLLRAKGLPSYQHGAAPHVSEPEDLQGLKACSIPGPFDLRPAQTDGSGLQPSIHHGDETQGGALGCYGGRPLALKSGIVGNEMTPYPHAPQIHYAFLNSRDRDRFTVAGLPEDRSRVFSNPIRLPDATLSPSASPARVLYAVRGIRRKNLGEVFLLAALSPAGTRYATTLAPTQIRWLPYFNKWRSFATSSGLPVDLAVVGRIATENGNSSFEAWQAQATHFLTTSVAEGFGLVFLEAIALGKPLFGRDLPAISRDHAANGIQAGRLYERLLIPAAWIDAELLRQHLTAALRDLFEAYGCDLTSGFVDGVSEAMDRDGHLDFGNLPEDLQQSAIQHLLDGAAADEVLVEIAGERFPAAKWLEETLAERTPTATADQLAPYSPEAHLTRLTRLYDELLAVTPQPPAFLPMPRVLAQYLQPENFHFLLT